MSLSERLFLWAILGLSVPAGMFMFVGIALHFVGAPVMKRRRTAPIRLREYPAWENWLSKHYPKATKDEAEIIRRVVEALARDARCEPTQLLPEDRLSGFVLPSEWEYFIGADGESDLPLEMEQLFDDRDVGMDDRSLSLDEPNETVGDAIDFTLKRICPRSTSAAEPMTK